MADHSEVPPFNSGSARYDQNTFWGRLRHFREVTDLTTLFTSEEKLQKSLQILKSYKQMSPRPSDAELWDAKRIKDAIVHPDTGEKIPLPLRVSAFVPANMILCAGLLTPNPSVFTTIFWQFANQSYNVALNHANRNASNEMSTQQIATSFLAAVSVSCGVALGMRQVVEKGHSLHPTVRSAMKLSIPFLSVTLAGIANVYIMRRNETVDGIQILSSDGEVLGKSAIAGSEALKQVAMTRVLTAMPVLLLPSIILNQVCKLSWVKANPRAVLPINLAIIGSILYTSLPAAIAVFPQMGALPITKVEPEFQNRKNSKGELIKEVYYNKGL